MAKAKAMAIALQTIGKFVIKKKVGESDQIYGRSASAGLIPLRERRAHALYLKLVLRTVERSAVL